MSYKLYDGGVIHLASGKSIVADPANRDWRKYLAWVADGNTPEAADPAPPPPTNDEIYDQVLQNQRVFKAFVLAVNDGSIVPGANMTPAALKAAVKAHM